MSEPDSGASPNNQGEPGALRNGEISKQLDRAIEFYGICLRDYFSTFSAYSTATTILVAAIGFLVRDNPQDSSPLILLVAICGLVLCLQWHVSTTIMRAQIGHFKSRIEELEKAAGIPPLLSRWLRATKLARERRSYKALTDQEKSDIQPLNWTFRFLDSPLGLRGRMLPVIYAAIFLGVGLSFSPFPQTEWFAFAVALLWLLVLPVGIHYLRTEKFKKFRIISLSLLSLLLLAVFIWSLGPLAPMRSHSFASGSARSQVYGQQGLVCQRNNAPVAVVVYRNRTVGPVNVTGDLVVLKNHCSVRVTSIGGASFIVGSSANRNGLDSSIVTVGTGQRLDIQCIPTRSRNKCAWTYTRTSP